ncbi:MAG: iron ABC transporter permease [Oscillospiraceae bacterium]|nr:iron ABC transporter permease [Oscillospiraceae bacterium]
MVVFIIFLSLFFIFVLLNIMIGSVMIQPKEIFQLLLGHGGNETSYGILWKVRFPRMIAAVLLGGALSLSGFLLQTFFNNPIAGPFVLGISSGAKLAVAFIMVLTLSRSQAVHSIVLVMAAFIGAMGSMGFVLLMSQIVRQSSMLIVSGVMIGYICSAITDFIVTFADDASIVNLHNWSLGSFSGTAWADIQVIAVVVITASVLVFLLSKPIGAYQLGESYAQNMGVNIKAFRILIVILSSLLSACVTAFAGPISFVGIAVPHLVKSFLKTAKPLIVIPMCFLGGAIFCLGCDLAARTIFAPVELSISSVTALIGAPVVIGILLKKKGHG